MYAGTQPKKSTCIELTNASLGPLTAFCGLLVVHRQWGKFSIPLALPVVVVLKKSPSTTLVVSVVAMATPALRLRCAKQVIGFLWIKAWQTLILFISSPKR